MKAFLLAAAAALSPPDAAQAHFLLPYVDDTQVDRPGDVPMGLVFWHPFENGHVMAMETPEAFYMIHNGETVDLTDRLVPATFRGSSNEAAAFRATVPVKRSGDYVVVAVPAPYYEASEDVYIQQLTKVVLNRNTLPTDWDRPVGLPAEIIPLDKPYNIITGGSFTGRVLADGEPVAGAEIEIEYVASAPDLEAFSTTAPTVSPMPGGALVTLSDEDGYFTFAVPRAGWWGFAALGVGPATAHDGKDLSQDAVMWIRAYDLE